MKNNHGEHYIRERKGEFDDFLVELGLDIDELREEIVKRYGTDLYASYQNGRKVGGTGGEKSAKEREPRKRFSLKHHLSKTGDE